MKAFCFALVLFCCVLPAQAQDAPGQQTPILLPEMGNPEKKDRKKEKKPAKVRTATRYQSPTVVPPVIVVPPVFVVPRPNSVAGEVAGPYGSFSIVVWGTESNTKLGIKALKDVKQQQDDMVRQRVPIPRPRIIIVPRRVIVPTRVIVLEDDE